MEYIKMVYYHDKDITHYIDVPIKIIEEEQWGDGAILVEIIGSDYGSFYVYSDRIKSDKVEQKKEEKYE